jgi:hypothetical protein
VRARRNTDKGERELQRKASGGNRAAQAKLLIAQIRAGKVPKEEVDRLLAGCDQVALEALGRECGDVQILLSAGKKNRLTGAQAEGVLRSYYHALGYERDGRSSAGSLLSPDGQIKIAFKKTVVQILKGGRGRWLKYSSNSKISTAERMVAHARQRSEPGSKAAEKHKARKKKGRAAKAKKSSAAAQRALQIRVAVVQIASTLSPGDRAAVMSDADAGRAYAGEVMQRANAAVVHPGDTKEKIDALLSIKEPPVPLPKGEYKVDGKWTKYNGEHEWHDKALDRPVRIWSHSKTKIGVELGSMPVDPFGHQITHAGMARSMTGKGARGDGFTGSFRNLGGRWSAFLFMIISGKPRTGLGTRYLRAWCRLIKAYGTHPIWTAEAVGKQGTAFLAELEHRGELEITGQDGSYLFVRCHRALADSRQGFLFAPAKRNPWGWPEGERVTKADVKRRRLKNAREDARIIGGMVARRGPMDLDLLHTHAMQGSGEFGSIVPEWLDEDE